MELPIRRVRGLTMIESSIGCLIFLIGFFVGVFYGSKLFMNKKFKDNDYTLYESLMEARKDLKSQCTTLDEYTKREKEELSNWYYLVFCKKDTLIK